MTSERARQSQPATILFVHASDELYGSDVMLLQLVRSLDPARYRPLVVLPTDLPYEGLLSAELRRAEIACVKLDLAVVRRRYATLRQAPHFLRRLVRSTAQLVRLIRRERVALVHSNTIVVWGGALAALLTRRPHVWQVHELLTGSVLLRRAAGLAVTLLSARVIPNSRATRAALVGSRRWPRRVQVIPNGVAPASPVDAAARAQARAAWGAQEGDVLVGMVGRLSPRKGVREFLEAATSVAAQVSGSRFVVVGGPAPGQEDFADELRARARDRRLAGRVVFAGFRRDSAAVLDALDVVVAPALLPESFGLSAAEAMAHGRPVVASRLGGLAELITDDETGLLVPPGDMAALSAAILRLVRDPDLRVRLGRAGQTRVASRYGLDRYAAAMVRLYDEVLAPPPG